MDGGGVTAGEPAPPSKPAIEAGGEREREGRIVSFTLKPDPHSP